MIVLPFLGAGWTFLGLGATFLLGAVQLLYSGVGGRGTEFAVSTLSSGGLAASDSGASGLRLGAGLGGGGGVLAFLKEEI